MQTLVFGGMDRLEKFPRHWIIQGFIYVLVNMMIYDLLSSDFQAETSFDVSFKHFPELLAPGIAGQ